MAGVLVHVTKAGRAALVAAGNKGTAACEVITIGVATKPFDAADETLAALPNERKRLATIAGANIAPDTIHVTLKDDTDDQYALYGFGLYLENDVLFAVYCQTTPIMEKSPSGILLLAADMRFTELNAAQLCFGDATFANPPASTERLGVVELATDAETQAGTDTKRVVTPAGLQSALTVALAAKSNTGHHHAITHIDGLQSALDSKSPTGHGHTIASVSGLQSALDSRLGVSGGEVTGDVRLKSTGMYSPRLLLDANGYAPFLRAGSLSRALEAVNSSNTAINASLDDNGVLSLPRARPNWAGGLVPWDSGNFDPDSRVAKSGGHMSGDLYVDSGGLHLSGWGGNTNAGVAFLNAAGSRYVYYDGTQYSMPGAELLVAQGNKVWHNGNFNPALYQAAGDYLRNHTSNATSALYFNSAAPPNIATINSSGNADNVALTIGNAANSSASAVMQFHRQGSYAAYFGLDTDNQWAVGGRSMGNVRYRLWHEGNFNPGSYAPVRNGNLGNGYVIANNQSVQMTWDGATYQMYTDLTYIGNMLHSNNCFNFCTPRSSMDYGGVGSYTYMNTGANPGVNQLVNLPGLGGTWRVMSGAFGANGKDILYVRIG